jgi:nitrile hydratase subunit beta
MSSPDPLFRVGQAVRILDLGKPGHVRTPTYVRNKVGLVERCCGKFDNPEERAYRRRGNLVYLYRVRLRQPDLWPGYAQHTADTLDVEIYEHWLAAEPRDS